MLFDRWRKAASPPIRIRRSAVSAGQVPDVSPLRTRLKERLASFHRDDRGIAVVEFAVASPVLTLFVIGTIKFGLAVGQHVMITHAAAQAAGTLALSRGSSAPYSTTVSAIAGAAPALNSRTIGTTVKVNGVACTSDAGCVTLLSAGASAQVTVTYACDLSVMGFNFRPDCKLSASSAHMIQ